MNTVRFRNLFRYGFLEGCDVFNEGDDGLEDGGPTLSWTWVGWNKKNLFLLYKKIITLYFGSMRDEEYEGRERSRCWKV